MTVNNDIDDDSATKHSNSHTDRPHTDRSHLDRPHPDRPPTHTPTNPGGTRAGARVGRKSFFQWQDCFRVENIVRGGSLQHLLRRTSTTITHHTTPHHTTPRHTTPHNNTLKRRTHCSHPWTACGSVSSGGHHNAQWLSGQLDEGFFVHMTCTNLFVPDHPHVIFVHCTLLSAR